MKQYIVDAFTDTLFHGNPAAVCVCNSWLSDELMANIAKENNLSETAFAVGSGGRYGLRWFTPGGEIDLCGHATLATAFVLMTYYEPNAQKITFSTQSGELAVVKKGDLYEMTFPAYELHVVPVTQAMADAFGAQPLAAYKGRDLLCVFGSEAVVRSLSPDGEKLCALDGLLHHATAPADSSAYDCVSRSFAPKLRVAEDPVCGSGHCHIVPYWAERLGKSNITAYQASARGGILYCTAADENVLLAGKAVLFSVADVRV